MRDDLGRLGSRAGKNSGRLLADSDEDDWPAAPDTTGGTQRLTGPAMPGQAAFRLMGEWADGPEPPRLLDEPGPEWPEEAGYAEPGRAGRRHRPARAAARAGRRGTVRRPRRPGAARPLRGTGSGQHAPGSWDHGRPSFTLPRWLTAMARQPWYVALSRYRWYVSIGAGAGVMALASGVILILPRQSPTAMMNGCGLMPCKATARASQRSHAPAAATPGSAVNAHPSASPTALPRITVPPPAPITSQAAMVQATSTPPAALPASVPAVRASYQLVSRWNGGIVGQFSIVNTGSIAATSWQLVAAFPGDQIQFVIGAADAVTGGDSLVLSPPSAGSVLAPGGSLTVVFTAWGLAAAPSTCTIDGVPC